MLNQQRTDQFYLLKIIIVGDGQVGKSSLITRFFDKKFWSTIVSTVGVDFRIMKNVKLKTGKLYQISIWDTAGQEQFKSIVRFSCKGSDGAIVCFDLSDISSLKSVKEWVSYIRLHCPEHIAIALVGTKSDLPIQINIDQIKQVLIDIHIEGQQIKYFSTSSKTQEGVDKMFYHAFEVSAVGKEKTGAEIHVEESDPTYDRNKESRSIKLSSVKSMQQTPKPKQECCQ